MGKNREIQTSILSSYLAWEDFELVCRKTLHSNAIDTPPEHSHRNFYELVVVASGSGTHRIQGQDWRIIPGNVFLIDPHQKHWYVEYDRLEIYNLLFSRKFIRYFLPDLTQLDGFQLIFNLKTHQAVRSQSDGIRIREEFFPEIVHVLEEMDQLNSSRIPGDKTLLLSDFVRVMLLLSRHSHWSGPPKQLSHIGQLTKLLTELEKGYAAPWSLEKMAARTHMSVSGFRQEFRRLTGMAPIEYLLGLRLDKAAMMLQVTALSLPEIARDCGFQDVNYFSRQFKKHHRILPSHYRKKE